MERVFPRNQLKPLAKMARGYGEWFEILLKIRRTKVVGTSAE
jgi:hypothetical protein